MLKYLQQFCLDVHYKSEKTNIILNALSQLASHEYQLKLNVFSLNILYDTIFIFINNLVKLLSKFWQCFLDNYIKEVCWQQVFNMITRNDVLNINAATLLYTHIHSLLYYKNIEKNYWLCISLYLYEEVFVLIHDVMRHSEYTRIHECLINNLYLLNLLKHLHKYIQHCLQCQLIQTSKCNLYKFMQFILTSLWLFYVLIIDFILVLSASLKDYNIILSVTDKFNKTMIFILRQKIMITENWTIQLLNHLALLNWDLSCAILLDRDCKFIIVL